MDSSFLEDNACILCYSFFLQRSESGDDLLAEDSLPDMDASVVLFIMAYRCSNTEKPRKSGYVSKKPVAFQTEFVIGSANNR